QAPSITGQPQDLAVCPGQSASFNVTAGANALVSYQWRLNGVNIAGATGSTYTINAVSAANGGDYSVVVSNACGPTTSSVAVLKLNPAPSITGQPQNLAVCPGQSASFIVTAGGTGPLSYQWRL